ncbi:MAG: DUF4185 domain-containing protein, partial [Actinomycetota bacterium]|nr:DUF4185 domain-containing protein [Actinomycetota bacterium]
TTPPRLFVALGIAGVVGLALPVTKGAAASTGQTGQPTEVVAKLTGPDSLNRTDRWNVYGTDLGHMFRYGNQLRFTFGDTFGQAGTDPRDNTMAWSTDTTVHDGLKFDNYVTDRPRHAKELFDDPNDPSLSVIPTNGIAVGDRMFLHYMAVRQWLEPGHWDVAYSGLAYSDDKGRTWKVSPNVKWGDDSNFAQVGMLRLGDGYVYLFGIPEGRFGGLKLARVPETKEALLDPNAYRYWTGSGWGDEQSATEIVPAPVGELSVRWSQHHQRWLMTYLNDANQYDGHDAIVVRSASSGLTGPWSDELVLTTSADYPQLYAPYQVPDQPDGADLYYTMSRFDHYNVFLMRSTLTLPAS